MTESVALTRKIPRYILGDFEDLKHLEQGGYGAVYRGKLPEFGLVALKQFVYTSEKSKKEHAHPNIVQLFGILWDGHDESVYLGFVMEFVEGGSLHNVIYDETRMYDIPQIYTWIEQISRGLLFLHNNQIMHRDIKPKKLGTYLYMAPEAISVLDEEIYAIGGRDAKDKYRYRVQIFDGTHWRDGPSLPCHFCSILSTTGIFQHTTDRLCEYEQRKSRTILITARVDRSRATKKKKDYIAVLKADRSAWIELELKLPSRGGVAVYLNEELYIVGGTADPKNLYKLNNNMKWIRLADMIVERYGITKSCLEWNGYIWVFGGEDIDDQVLKSVERYDPKEDKWTLMPDMQKARACAAAVLWKDKIIISGGLIRRRKNNITNTIECYNPESGHQMEFRNMPLSLYSHSLIFYKNKLILKGGFDKMSPRDTVWEIDPNDANAKWKQLERPNYSWTSVETAETVLEDEIYALDGRQPVKDDAYLSRVEIFNGEYWRDGPSFLDSVSDISAVNIPQQFANCLCDSMELRFREKIDAISGGQCVEYRKIMALPKKWHRLKNDTAKKWHRPK